MSNRLMNAIMGNTHWNLWELGWFGALRTTRTVRGEEGESEAQSDALVTCQEGVSTAQVLCVLGQLPPETKSYTDLTRLFWVVRENHLVLCKSSFGSFTLPEVYKHS